MRSLGMTGILTLLLTAGSLSLGGCHLMGDRDENADPESAEIRPASAQVDDGSELSEVARVRRDLVWKGVALPTGDRTTSAIWIEKGLPREVRVDRPFDYQIEVTNLTDLDLVDVIVSDAIPAAFRFENSTPAMSATQDGVTLWELGVLGPREKSVISVRGVPSAIGALDSCASVSYRSKLCTTLNVVDPKLELIKEAPADALVCDPIPVIYRVLNTGSGTARDVKISESLPENLLTVDGESSVLIELGDLAAGEARESKVALSAAAGGAYEGSAQVSADGGLQGESNRTRTVTREPALGVTATGPAAIFLGRNITYNIQVKNSGDGVAHDTVVESTLPKGALFVSASDGGRRSGSRVVWRVGALDGGEERRVSMTVSAADPGTLRSATEAKAYCAETVAAEVTTELRGVAAILLEVIDTEDPILVGESVTYEIRVTNQGTAPDTAIAVACSLEGTMEYLSTTGPTAGEVEGQEIRFAPLANLAPKEEVTWKVVVKAAKSGDVRFSARITSDQKIRPIEETESTFFIE